MLNYAQLQAEISGMSKSDAVAHLLQEFPHKSKSWFERNLTHLMALDPLGLYRFIGHSDPTANKAIRNVMKGIAA